MVLHRVALNGTRVIDVFCPHFKCSILSYPLRVLEGTALTPTGPTDGKIAVYALGPKTCRDYCTSSQDSCHQLLGPPSGLASTQQFPSLIQLNHKHQSLTILLSLQHWARLLAACPGTYSGKSQLPSDQLREE